MERLHFELSYKRLEKHQFPWPRTTEQARCEIDTQKLHMMLEGIDFWSAHQELTYTKVS